MSETLFIFTLERDSSYVIRPHESYSSKQLIVYNDLYNLS